MKPPNHGKRVIVRDPFLIILTGRLLYTPEKRDSFRIGLSIRTLDGVEPMLATDRIEIIP